MKKGLLLFWTLASLLILLAMVFGLVLPWPFQRQDMAQAADAWLNGYSYRTPVNITGASVAGGNYTIGPIIVYRGTATTLENGSWTVNGTAYTSRFSFTVEERSGSNLTNYAIKAPLDTQSLVEGGYFNTAANGDEVEFTTSGGTVLNYWLDTTAFGAPDCVYYIKSGLTASSTASFYCYLNPAANTTSTSFSLANTLSSIDVYTAASADDCAYYYSGGQHFATNDVHVQAGCNGAGSYGYQSGMRWQVNIPQHSDIIYATFQVTANTGGTSDCATLIKIEQADSAAIYSTVVADYVARKDTQTYIKTVAWDITGAWTPDAVYSSPDIAVSIREVINRNGWVANNYLALYWDWNSSTPLTTGAFRLGYSYDGTATSTKRPNLTIYYIAPVSVSPLVSVPVLRANAVQALSNTVNWTNDIRVAASDGTTELPFYLDTKYEKYVKLYVKDTVDDLSTGHSAKIYVYYGKDGATSGADIASTFSFGDDFTGTELDTATNWNQTNTVGYGSAMAYNGMWLRPRYPAQRYVGTYDRTYITWVNNAGELKILAYDHTQKCYIGGTCGITIATGWFGDLYDSATILVIPSGTDAGKILVFAEKSCTTTTEPFPSNKGYGIYVYKSDLAEDISSWSLRTIVEPDNYALYPQPIVLSTGNIALFYSVPVGGPYIDACYVISTDAGDTWGARTILIRGDGQGTGTNTWIFPCVLQGGKETHVFFHTWNSTSRYVSLGYLYNDNDLDTTHWMKRDGTSCGNLTAAGLTHSVTDRLTSGRKPYVMDMALDNSNNPYLAYVDFYQPTLSLRCNWAYYSAGVGWVIRYPGFGMELGGFQQEIYDPYSTGISIDPKDPTHIFMGVRTDTFLTDVQELHTTDNGLTWTKVADITSGSPDLCYQPYCVRNYSDDLKLVFNVNMAFTDQQHWASYLCAYPLTVNRFHSVVLRGKASGSGVINSKNTLSGNYTFVSQVLQINTAPGNNTWFIATASTSNYNDTVARIYGDAATNYEEVVQSARTGQTTQTQTGLHLKTGFYQDWKIKWLGQDNATVSIDRINGFNITTCTGNASYITMVEGAKANTYTFVDYIFAMPAVPYEPTWTVGSQEVQGLTPTPTPTSSPSPTSTPSPSATPTPGSAQSTRHLPGSPQSPGQTFDVSVTFTAPSDNFNSIGLADDIPTGWAIQGNTTWCIPNADSMNREGNRVEYAWFGPYSSGQTFIALYKVSVPGNASLPSYTFSGQLNYKIGGGSRIFETIAGDSTLQVASGTPVNGITREVNGNILPGVSITLDGIASAVSGQDGQYEILAAATGNHTVIAHKDGFRDRTQSISIEGLGQGFAVTCNFQGQSGLIPKAPDMWYALDCVNLWLYPPNPDIGLDMWTALDVINAWLYPVQ